MAIQVMIFTITFSLTCCILQSKGEIYTTYVPLHSGKVGVPLNPLGFGTQMDDVAIDQAELIETAASDLESEVNLDEWEDESQDERVAYIAAGCQRATYVDVMIGHLTQHNGFMHPSDIGLTIIPTGVNRTSAKQTNGSEKTRKVLCVSRNITENATASVAFVNNTGLLSMLGLKNDTTMPNCAIVMFYAPWCPFCSKTAPHYNALARAFPQMHVLAIDAVHFSNLNARFGTVAVPNILIFHNAKAVARFNASMRTLPFMVEFVSNVTGLTAVPNVTVTELDLQGPLSSLPTKEPDYLLGLSWAFNILFFLYVFSKSSIGQRLLTSFATFGREPEHQHID